VYAQAPAQPPPAQTPKPPAAGTQAPAKPDSDTQNADNTPPAVTGGTPTITDTASINPPGWIEMDLGPLKDLNRDRVLGTPFLLKSTARGGKFQFRLSSDGYVSQNGGPSGYGNTYLGAHYLFATQEHFGYDLAARLTITLPTESTSLGGTGKFDYTGLFLASKDYTKWGLHGDYNLGLSSLSRPGMPGRDTQLLLAASSTLPIKGDRWQYTNELVYASPIESTRGRVTTMHGFAYAVHRYEVLSMAVQWQLYGDGATLQILGAASFYLARIF
jgi:hypothetical protein